MTTVRKEAGDISADFPLKAPIRAVYEVLRKFQDGKIEKTSVVCGKLTDELTVVLDRIIEAYREANNGHKINRQSS